MVISKIIKEINIVKALNMCGIAGIWTSESKEYEFERPLTKMLHILRHRGPNAREIKVFNGGGFGHARLSIIDVGNISNQPMVDDATGNILVFNGEIYNYLELKAELELLGHVFRTKSDTEVILKAYSAWGIECLNRFNGMWAFALYDRQNHVFFAARDRMGIKPFVYCINKKRI